MLSHLVVGQVNLVNVWEALREEEGDSASHGSPIKIQFPELPKHAGLIRHRAFNVEVSHM